MSTSPVTKPLTPAQRARKVAAAKKHLREARALLSEVCSDFAARDYIPYAELVEESAAIDLISPLERMALDA